MCGIVGVSALEHSLDNVIEGLSRLEYRGYDSAGISYKENIKIETIKKEGKLANLQAQLAKTKPKSSLIIGHTRWATHGKVNDINAHPHSNDTFAVVHNGIIENAHQLREELISDGEVFKSETDSEVFLVLLTKYFKNCDSIKESIFQAFEKISGNSAFVIISNVDDNIYGIRNNAPLVCGLGENEDVYMSSDPYALVGFTAKVFFPGDGVLCVGDRKNISNTLIFLNSNFEESQDFQMQESQTSAEVASKGDFEHFMLKEIHEQPKLIRNLADVYLSDSGMLHLRDSFSTKPTMIHIIGCGTALHAGMVIKHYLQKTNKISTLTDYASEFRYNSPVLKSSDYALFISQSGETADTLACQKQVKELGLKSFSIVNVQGSTLYRECDNNLLIHGGVEIGVASTKAFTLQVLTGLLLSEIISEKYEGKSLKAELSTLADKVQDILDREDEIKAIAEKIYDKAGYIFTGRGIQFPIALEGALKLKEIAYVHAEGYASGELKHGPISLIDKDMVNVAIVTPDLFEKTLSNAQEVNARQGLMLIIGEKGNKEVEEIADFFFPLDFAGLDKTQPVYVNIVLQLLSYHIAKLKGTDIDKPRNLAKSVTVE